MTSVKDNHSRTFSSSLIPPVLLLLALSACVSSGKLTEIATLSASKRDPDAISLLAMSEQARSIAQKESSEVVLRQVDTDLSTTDFRFVDKALTKEIMIVVPQPDAPADKWNTVVNSVSPLLGQAAPAIDIQNLRIGPKRVGQAITAHWSGCSVRDMTLYLENEKLTWVAFCNTPEGEVSGSMDAQTGEFRPSEAPPAPIPVTATPAP